MRSPVATGLVLLSLITNVVDRVHGQGTLGSNQGSDDRGCVLSVDAAADVAQVIHTILMPVEVAYATNEQMIDDLMIQRASLVISQGCQPADYDCFYAFADEGSQSLMTDLDRQLLDILSAILAEVDVVELEDAQAYLDYIGSCGLTFVRTLSLHTPRLRRAAFVTVIQDPADKPDKDKDGELIDCEKAKEKRDEFRNKLSEVMDAMESDIDAASEHITQANSQLREILDTQGKDDGRVDIENMKGVMTSLNEAKAILDKCWTLLPEAQHANLQIEVYIRLVIELCP